MKFNHRMVACGQVFMLAASLAVPGLLMADKEHPAPQHTESKTAPHGNAPHPAPHPEGSSASHGTMGGSHNATSNRSKTNSGSRGTAGSRNTPGNRNTTGNRGNMGNRNTMGGHGKIGNPGNMGNRNNMGGHGTMENRNATENRGHMGGAYHAARTTRVVGGHTVSRDPRGRVREIRTVHGTEIHRNLRGGTTLRTVHNGRIVYGDGRGHGYTQRAYFRDHRGRAYYQRTYIGRDGRVYARAYRGYYWRGHPYYGYAPVYYYHPGYYAWAYRPWPAPVYWSWGWGPSPWYGYYGYYFAPAPYYATPALWLTDFLLAADLQAAYQAGHAAGVADASQGSGDGAPAPASSNTTVTLTPEVKQAIADEVRQQIAADQQAAAGQSNSGGDASAAPASDSSDEPPPALDPKVRTFVVSNNLDVTGDNGEECSLSPGDVIFRTGNDVIEGTDNVTVMVQSSQKDDCAIGSSEAVSVSALQEMYNHFHEQVQSGMQAMAKDSGKNGMPQTPDTSTTSGEVPAPAADSDAASDLAAQQQDASQAEKQVSTDSGGGGQ